MQTFLNWFQSLSDTTQTIIMWCEVVMIIALFAWAVVSNRSDKEEIACAAIKFHDVGVMTLPAPARHHHIMWAHLFVNGISYSPGRDICGFLTTSGRFVDRIEGLKIAEKRDQLIDKHGSAYELYSEDMWETPPEAWGYTIAHHEQLKPTKKYFVIPGSILSKSDGQLHHISGQKLIKLYGADPDECLISELHGPPPQPGMIKLSPNYHGDYNLPQFT